MRLEKLNSCIEHIKISIHAPLTGCDFACAFDGACACCISIHAPLTGCDMAAILAKRYYITFQSTHPLRDATRFTCINAIHHIISIHAPLTGCDPDAYVISYPFSFISIHAPLTGCDLYNIYGVTIWDLFQSTHPLRDATLRIHLQT